MKKKIELIMAVILLVSAGFLAKRGAIYVQQSKVAKTQTCIVIDAGHGGDDPGKIGINGEKEKKLNLAIAKKLQKILVGVHIKMTTVYSFTLFKTIQRNKCCLIAERGAVQ